MINRHIVIVLGDLQLGGAEKSALDLARWLAKDSGVHIQVWGFNKSGKVAQLCEAYKIPWRLIPFYWSSHSIVTEYRLWAFKKLLRREKVEVLLPYTLFPNIICGLTWKDAGVRLCIWNQQDEGMRFADRNTQARAVKNTPLFISNSDIGSRFLQEELGVKKERLRVIRSGVELPPARQSRSEWRALLAVGEETPVICMLANLSRRKDHDTLLRAWKKVKGQCPHAVLVFAGRFDDRYEPLKKLSEELKIADRVRFLGPVDDVAGLLSSADLCVHSSCLEGCPNAVLEAMASGLAVAGTDIPGMREAVGTQGYPFLAAPKDADALAGKVVMLLKDTGLRAQLGAQNRRRIAEEFSLTRMGEETASLIMEMR